MLKHSMFSDSYLNHRFNDHDDEHNATATSGSLALSSQQQRDKKLVLCRASSRTWWETAWQMRK